MERAETREAYWTGADLAVEVVSGGAEDKVRDHVTKRAEYAEAGITEYWIVDPMDETFTVLSRICRMLRHRSSGVSIGSSSTSAPTAR